MVSEQTKIKSGVDLLLRQLIDLITNNNTIADEDGVGGGVVDYLNCIGFVNNSRALAGENYKNLKSQCSILMAKKINLNEVVEICNKHLGKIGNKSTEKNSVKCIWGDAFESIKSVEDDKYDKIFVDLNDDQFCIDLAAKNMDSLVRILKPNGVITAQVGSQDKKPKQVDSWLNVFNHHFGNTKLSRVYIPSFDCSWNFSSSINH